MLPKGFDIDLEQATFARQSKKKEKAFCMQNEQRGAPNAHYEHFGTPLLLICSIFVCVMLYNHIHMLFIR